MGTLANSLFQAMLGWIRTLSSQIWTTATSSESTTLIAWVGEHWVMLAILLCAVGLVLDFIVYLIRWQPWRAWRSFFRRIRNHEENAEEKTETAYGETVPGQTSASHDYIPENASNGAYARDEYTSRGCMYSRPMTRDNAELAMVDEKANSPREEEMQYAPRENEFIEGPEVTEPRVELLTWSRNEPEGTTAAFDQALRPKKRRRVSRIFTESEEETVMPDQLINQYAAYRRPVYPRSWQTEEGDRE